ncbi:protein phosphatase 1 regulatory subunit 3D [Gracilinanus agilis]|uniref:protein phosphatase 1 regulatory subunit 3D n=1 Tax=Gracilinanus agilis TaxID=191870 RepID=UPI001CFE91E8|nr:protein phosphatase 1 regulatory subunit 3D [Gracilinanus agilis]
MSKGPGSLVMAPSPCLRQSESRTALRSLSSLTDLDRGMSQEPKSSKTFSASGPQGHQQQSGPSSCDPCLRPIIHRRARSLPSSPERRKKASGTAGVQCRPGCSRQNRVRFADALGLELTQVKVFNAGEDPSIPLHVLSRLSINSDLCCSNQDLEFTLQCLVPEFLQPVDCSDFSFRLQNQRVCLERVTTSDLGVSGTIRVLNMAFEKQVTVRYTYNSWRTQQEVGTRWRSSAGDSDLFIFCFPVPPYLLGLNSVVQFAIRYRVGGDEYWDNNEGENYSLRCQTHPLKMPQECEESWIHFI